MKNKSQHITNIFKPILDFISDLFFPPMCCICNESARLISQPHGVQINLGGNSFESPFCPACSKRLEKAYGPWLRKAGAGKQGAYYLFDYSDETVKRAIRHIKTCKCSQCRRFFAKAAEECLDRLVADGSTLTYIPRSRKLYDKYEFDQSRCILQEYLKLGKNAHFAEIFLRNAGKFNNAPQKSLNYKQRFENARSSLLLIPNCKLPLSVVVFDDIITTGATADTAAVLLYSANVNSVKMFFLAEAPLIK